MIMNSTTYKIILADDHEILLESLEGLLSGEKDLKVVGKVNSGRELIERVALSVPDLCIVDMDMPEMNGLVASEKLLEIEPKIKIMILSMHKDKSLVKKMMDTGINGYLSKTCDREEFIFAIRQILKGKRYFSNDIIGLVSDQQIQENTADDLVKIGALTEREREVIRLICEGLTNKQIGERLFLSHKTVDNHRTHIMRKLDVHNMVELIRFSLKHGLAE